LWPAGESSIMRRTVMTTPGNSGIAQAHGQNRSVSGPSGEAPALSVVIVNYKTYAELDECLGSLLPAPASDLEVIVVDHSSSTPELERLSAKFPEVGLVPTQGNPGFSAGINAGARLARGRHLLILNPDTRMQPGAVDAMAAYLDSHSDTAVVGARVEDPGGTVQRSARRFPTMLTGLAGRSSLVTRLWPDNPLSRHDTLADATTTAPREVDWVAGSCMAVSADAFRHVGGMDEQFFLYWEDADLCKRLKEAGRKTIYLPSAVVVHGVGRSRRHARVLSVRAFHRSAYLYFRKHRAGRFRAISLPVARAALSGRMSLMLVAQAVTRRDWSER
jgi:N-acetylglucosaminyl-diphospho-decaprenol L-rhamnosyltransferase